jgi:virginiamycin B lyase
MRPSLRVFIAVLVLVLGACSADLAGNPAGVPAVRVPAASASSSQRRHIQVKIRIHVPRHHKHRARFISPSTKGITISVKGPTNLDETVGLTASSPGCSSADSGVTCTVSLALLGCPTNASCYTAAVATYDAVSCNDGACTIPHGANALSANQSVAFTIAAGTTNGINLTLDGIPTTAGIVPNASSTLTGNSGAGFTISKCVTTPQAVTVVGFDADGNQIVGPGSPTGFLTSDDTLHLNAVAQPWIASGAYVLVPPSSLQAGGTIPNAKSIVHFTAAVVPQAGTGSTSPVISQVNVQFNGDVCGQFTTVPMPLVIPTPEFNAAHQYGMVTGPDGAMWFTSFWANSIGRVTVPTTYGPPPIVTSYQVPHQVGVWGMAVGPDGGMWFSEFYTARIGRIGVDGQYTDYAAGFEPSRMTLGSDGALWYIDGHADIGPTDNYYVGRITTAGVVTTFALPTLDAEPADIAAGGDGNLWVTEQAAQKIARVTTAGVVTEFPVTSPFPAAATWGPDGALWFGNLGTDLGRMTKDGVVTNTYDIGNVESDVLMTGPDGNIWDIDGDGLLCISPAGTVLKTYYPVSEYLVGLSAITTGPDGAIWFTEASQTIGRLQ